VYDDYIGQYEAAHPDRVCRGDQSALVYKSVLVASAKGSTARL
jgi:hypothetical protein